jgi:thimet oligopeptidase
VTDSLRPVGRASRALIAPLAVALLAACSVAPVYAAIELPRTAAEVSAATTADLAKAQQLLDGMLAAPGPRTVANTLGPMNELSIVLDHASARAALLENTHPDAELRAAAEKASQDISAFVTDFSLNRKAYEAVSAVTDATGDMGTERHWKLLLRDYRRSGVDKDDATRARIKEIRDQLVKTGQDFERNIREKRRSIEVTPAEMDGLTPDYIAAHKPDSATGKIRITTDYPDFIPFMTYTKNSDARRRILFEYNNRAFPENKPVLEKLLALRYDLAKQLGYSDWATYITEDKMSKSPTNVASFVERLDKATKKRADADYVELLEQAKKIDPKSTAVNEWDRRYLAEQVRADKYSFDAQALRPYFNYTTTKQGVIDLTEKLFDVQIERVEGAAVWHPTVEAYVMRAGDKLVGEFFLDMHPRDGKFTHAAMFPLRTGLADRQIPVGVLVCNLPQPDDKGLALLEHDDFETFLHEFGHLVHFLFAGHQRWLDRSGISMEWDFVEAPSQMLEEWAVDPATLATFARHYETGAPVPAELVQKLRAARDFGRGMWVRQQLYYTALSLNIYDRPPAQVDLDKTVSELQNRYVPFPFMKDTHMYTSFGHLDGYSAIYYTYMWSLVIAKDMFSRFDEKNMLDPKVAAAYRRLVLEPGGTKDANDLLKDFLGRSYDFAAFERWMSGKQGT